MGTGVWRCWRNVRRTTFGPARSASSSGDTGKAISAPRFVPNSGCTIGTPSSSARSTSITAGSASMSTSTSSAASSAMYRLSATINTIGSPTNRTSPSASGRRGAPGASSSSVGCIVPAWGLRSAAVSTAIDTRRARAAAAVSTPRIRPRATSLRTNVQCDMPREHDVVDVATVAGQQARVLAPLHRLTDEPTRGRRAHSATPAARCTARTMPW